MWCWLITGRIPGCPGRLWSPSLQTFQPLQDLFLCHCSRWPRLGREVGLADPQRFLQMLTNLWFCASVMQSSGCTGQIVNTLIPQIQLQGVGGFWARVETVSIEPLQIPTFGNQHCLVVFHPFTKWMESVTHWTVVQLFSVALYQWRIPKETLPRAKKQESRQQDNQKTRIAYESTKMNVTQQHNLKVLNKWNIPAGQAWKFRKLLKGSDKDWNKAVTGLMVRRTPIVVWLMYVSWDFCLKRTVNSTTLLAVGRMVCCMAVWAETLKNFNLTNKP